MEYFSQRCVTVKTMYILLVSQMWEVSISDAIVQSQAYPIFDPSMVCMDDSNSVVVPVGIPPFIIIAEARWNRFVEMTATTGMS